MKRLIYYCIFCWTIFLVQPVLAEVLTFPDALRKAREKNLARSLAEAKYIQAHSISIKTIASYLPRINATGTYTHNFEEASFRLPISPTETKTITIQPKDQLGAQVQLSQMILSPWIISQLASLNKYETSIKLHHQHAQKEIVFAVAKLYYGLASAKKAVAIQEKLLESRQNREKESQIKFDQGYIIKAELLQAQMDTIKNKQDLVLAENTYAASRLVLATLLNRDADFDIEEPPAPQTPTEQEVLGSTLKTRLDLQASLLQAELAESSRNSSFWRYLPDLGFFANYKGSDVENMGGKKHNFAIGLNLTWNIFDGGMREAEIYDHFGKALEARTNHSIKELEIKRDIETAKLELKSAIANKETAQNQVELARENFRVVSISNELGTVSSLEYTDASNRLANAEIGYITQSFQCDLAVLSLQHVLGTFE